MRDVTEDVPSLDIRAVVLDAMGVIYKASDDVAELLVPFLKRKGCSLSDDRITALYKECSLGKFSSSQLWELLGMVEDGDSLDSEYLENHELSDGLIDFLDQASTQGLLLACLSNDVAEWSIRLRQKYGLARYICHWTVSGEVRSRKPAVAIYNYLLRESDWTSQEAVFVDDQVKNLDTARKLGFRTLWFSKDSSRNRGYIEHQRVSSFEEVNSWLMKSKSR